MQMRHLEKRAYIIKTATEFLKEYLPHILGVLAGSGLGYMIAPKKYKLLGLAAGAALGGLGGHMFSKFMEQPAESTGQLKPPKPPERPTPKPAPTSESAEQQFESSRQETPKPSEQPTTYIPHRGPDSVILDRIILYRPDLVAAIRAKVVQENMPLRKAILDVCDVRTLIELAQKVQNVKEGSQAYNMLDFLYDMTYTDFPELKYYLNDRKDAFLFLLASNKRLSQRELFIRLNDIIQKALKLFQYVPHPVADTIQEGYPRHPIAYEVIFAEPFHRYDRFSRKADDYAKQLSIKLRELRDQNLGAWE